MSGDPLPDRVMLWTRIEPTLDAGVGIDVTYEVAISPAFAADVVTSGVAHTSAVVDHTVKIDVGGLDPAGTYYYRFVVGAHVSPVGRTRTAPIPGSDPGPVRFAYFSCQRYTHGYYASHADLAGLASDLTTDLDFVVSLGDYVYDTASADGFEVRPDPTGDAVTLADFRRKYHLYRSDTDLQAMQALYPLICIPDNHDGSEDRRDPQGPGATAAFFEQLPVREFGGGSTRIHRRIQWGSQLDLFLLDNRQYRSDILPPSGNALGTHSAERPEMFDPTRTMLGADQLHWLLDGLIGSSARWKVVASPQMFWPWRTQAEPGEATDLITHPGRYLNLAQWDGYQAERRAILLAIEQEQVHDVLVISGDDHLWSAAEVSPDFDDCAREPVVAEFNGSSITSANADERGLPLTPVAGPLLRAVNPFLRYFQGERHGHTVVAIGTGETEVEYRSPLDPTQPTSLTETLATFRVASGSSRIHQRTGARATPVPACTEGAGHSAPAGTGPVPGRPSFTG